MDEFFISRQNITQQVCNSNPEGTVVQVKYGLGQMAWCNKFLNISFQVAVNLSIVSEISLAAF